MNEIRSYAIDTEVKLSQRPQVAQRVRHLQPPWCRVDGGCRAHTESGLLAHFQLASVSKVTFPNSNRPAPHWHSVGAAAAPGLHYGAAVAREMVYPRPGRYPRADEQMNPLGMATTNFNTSYLLGGWSYGIFTRATCTWPAKDFRGLNTSTVCAGLPCRQ